MPINEYLKQVKQRFKSGISTEHTYRSDLQVLLNSLVLGITVTNEPKRQKCGAPDYILQKKEVPLGYIEAKDIGIDLNKIEKSDQIKRYLGSLNNLILTDYLEFRFYKYSKKVKTIQIASIINEKLKTHPENFESFQTHINDFCGFKGQTIKSAEKLAQMMAQKARMMEEVLHNAVKDVDEDNTLKDQLKAFRQILIHDLDEKAFADIYAQTIAYGLFAARLHDETLDDFSRQEARDLIPKSNPFLRNLFDYVSGAQLDDRVVWIVDDLCEIFRATDLQSILSDFGKATGQNDPFLHFYETFLAEYDPKLRRSRGVYYTPEPVVNFIVRAVDDILKDEFGLSKGLADTTKIKVKYDSDVTDKRSKTGYKQIEKEVHKVQILDPAVGTGTFLAGVIKQIYNKFTNQKGIWSNYVENELLPRINGFEILMAPYAMCHLKLEMLLRETGYKPKDDNKQQRLRVFLTNSLEEAHPDTGTLFASWLSREATEANYVKRDTPIMCVIGNPPYAISSTNKGEWIQNLLIDYKKNLKERKINIDDDYIKFIRYGQYFIDKNSEGILAYISNNSFIDGITHRIMRKNLIGTFNKIYIIDFHGNSFRKEKDIDGGKDENVFDIQQGVSINIFIKQKSNTKKTRIYHFNVYGIREKKYHFLLQNSIKSINWRNINPSAPYYFFTPQKSSDKIYDEGFSLREVFKIVNSGIKTDRDSLFIDDDKKKLNDRMKILFSNDLISSFIETYRVVDSGSYKITKVIKNIQHSDKFLRRITYRPFDEKYIYYDPEVISRPAYKAMKYMISDEKNILLCFMRQYSYNCDYSYALLSNNLVESRVFISNKGIALVAPLFLFSPENSLIDEISCSNFREDFITKMVEKTALNYNLNLQTEKTFSSYTIIDYIYAVLHSSKYRRKYDDLLKIDYPKIPYPKDADYFRSLAGLGSELRHLHLLENITVEQFITVYPVDGSNIVEEPKYKNEKIWINKTQYFDNVLNISWNYYIGGYQPAQKWLKDRKRRKLSFQDIVHYQKVILALDNTDRIMKEIDKIIEL